MHFFCILYLHRFSWNIESIWPFQLFYSLSSSMNSWYFPIVLVTKKTPFQMDMQINSWFFSYCGGLSFQSNPIFKSYCKKHNGLICWFLSSKVPKNKSLNFEFDFNHWVLYVRLAKRTDFSIIDPKKTFFHPFQGIYCNYNEKLRQKCDLVIFFDWGVIWLIWLY